MPEVDDNSLIADGLRLHMRHLERKRALVNSAPFAFDPRVAAEILLEGREPLARGISGRAAIAASAGHH
jgi:hypothetical protein